MKKILWLVLLLCAIPFSTHALKLGLLEDLIRKGARLGDDVPLNQADAVAARLARSGAADDFLEQSLRRSGKNLDELSAGARKAARAAEAGRILKAVSNGMDPALVRQLDNLDEAAKGTALMLAQGSRTLARNVPDIAVRGRLVKAGGADMLAALGMHGDDVTRSAMRLNAALDAGRVMVPAGRRVPTLTDFGKAMTRFGAGSKKFWDTTIRPHWKIWLASGALTAYILDPEGFQNATGELTEAGFQALTQLAGEAAAGAIRGVGEGSGAAAEAITQSLRETIFASPYSIAGVVAFLLLMSLFFKRVRYYALAPFRWLNRSPREDRADQNWWH